MNWEKMDENTQRTMIDGGWLVRTICPAPGDSGSKMMIGGIAFVPDTKHKWNPNVIMTVK
jgi:hypothetical protein